MAYFINIYTKRQNFSSAEWGKCFFAFESYNGTWGGFCCLTSRIVFAVIELEMRRVEHLFARVYSVKKKRQTQNAKL